MVKAEHRIGRKAALTANQRATDIDLIYQKGHGSTGVDFPGIPDRERAANAATQGDVEADPNKSVRIDGRHGPAAIFGHRPGAVVEVWIGPAEPALGVVAEVVADQCSRFGLLC